MVMQNKKKIFVFTGAGVSKESGIDTFRDKGGLWDNYSVEEVADIRGWYANKEKVLDFYNIRRSELEHIKPNKAHLLLKDLENYFDVTIVTQNVDDLHEKAGSSNIIHLHGELTKVKIEDKDDDFEYYIGYKPIKIGDTPETLGFVNNESLLNQLRPAVVWFGENVPNMEKAYDAQIDADIMVVIGTSLQVYPAANLVEYFPTNKDLYVIDPDANYLPVHLRKINYIEKSATDGMKVLFDHLTKTL